MFCIEIYINLFERSKKGLAVPKPSLSLRKSFDSLLLFFSTFLYFFVPGGTNKLTLQVVNVAFAIKKVLLIIAFDLNAAEPLLRQVFRVVNVDDIVFFVFFAILLRVCLLLKSNQLALCQPIDI